jgi:hypothetical protein
MAPANKHAAPAVAPASTAYRANTQPTARGNPLAAPLRRALGVPAAAHRPPAGTAPYLPLRRRTGAQRAQRQPTGVPAPPKLRIQKTDHVMLKERDRK